MLQKITKKLVATLVATITAFTLLFMAQPAQATAGANLQAGSAFRAGFDLGKCAEGAAVGAVTIGVGAGTLLERTLKAFLKGVRFAGPAGFVVGTAAGALYDCVKKGVTLEGSMPLAPVFGYTAPDHYMVR